MILAIDIGNTNTVLGFFDQKNLIVSNRFTTDSGITSDELIIKLYSILEFYQISKSQVEAVVISNVVPNLNNIYQIVVDSLFKCSNYFVRDFLDDLPITISYNNSGELGDDRVANAIAGFFNYSDDLIVIDFGTAITFDIVSRKKGYLGGVILPGVNLAINYLSNATAKLPKIELKRPNDIVGKNTAHAMESGLFYGYLSMLEGLIVRIAKECAVKKSVVVATGGMGKIFYDNSEMINVYDHDLTLCGLNILYNKTIKDL